MKTILGAGTLLVMLTVLTGCQTTQPDAAFDNFGQEVHMAGSTPDTVTGTAPPVASVGSVQYADKFRVGDVVSVTFSGTSEPIPAHEERIKEDGTITLSLVGSIQAAGRSAGELQRELQEEFGKYYKTLVVTVASFQRFYYVGGEVRKPGALPYLGETSVTKAIQAAGDFTDFAKKNSIRVIRNDGSSLTVNFGKLIDNPKLDPPIYPGDKIHVPRRLLW